ncbi:hypothetical protein [Streptomyces sp. AC512_CC834]|uniref:hypothetical protein n=1 Tax=Streptomyces sp. AC512_CC834 TaxID=2823691 RepID=UPI0020B8062A|nr:hypothetical protein [Streptomyces sp. AC512_CC834]
MKDEDWIALRPGAWAEPKTAVDPGLRLKAAQLLHPELVVSHRTSARLWRIETWEGGAPTGGADGPVDFTDPLLTSRRRLTGVHVHHLPLADTDVETMGRHRLRITSVARTLGDLLRSGPRDDALVAVESALTQRRFAETPRSPLITPTALADALAAPLLGGTRARQWLTLVDLGAGSPAETLARLRMRDAGLRPETQAEVRTRGGRRPGHGPLQRDRALPRGPPPPPLPGHGRLPPPVPHAAGDPAGAVRVQGVRLDSLSHPLAGKKP